MPYATRIREREPDAQSACGRTENKQRDAGHTEQRAGHAVTNFNIPLTVEWVRLCRRANGRRRLVALGPPPAAAEDALTEMASLR